MLPDREISQKPTHRTVYFFIETTEPNIFQSDHGKRIKYRKLVRNRQDLKMSSASRYQNQLLCCFVTTSFTNINIFSDFIWRHAQRVINATGQIYRKYPDTSSDQSEQLKEKIRSHHIIRPANGGKPSQGMITKIPKVRSNSSKSSFRKIDKIQTQTKADVKFAHNQEWRPESKSLLWSRNFWTGYLKLPPQSLHSDAYK